MKLLQPGDEIILSKGIWKDVQLAFWGDGTQEKPITLTVEAYGETTLEGQSSLNLYGQYLMLTG